MVFVINKNKKPLCMVSNAEARLILKDKNAVVHKIQPFTIRLKKQVTSVNETYTIKIDPGSKHTGIAIIEDNSKSVCMLIDLEHRGLLIKKLMSKRRNCRRHRRYRKTRYREVRFLNRKRRHGTLYPSIKSRADNIINLVKLFSKLINISRVDIEEVSFDTTSMAAGLQLYGKEYANGPASKLTVKQYLFKLYGGTCQYCGEKASEIEHIHPKARGGTNRLENLTIACRKCNELKGSLSLSEFEKVTGTQYLHLHPYVESPSDAANVQSYKNYLLYEIEKAVHNTNTYLSRYTKRNRESVGLPKEHFYDALCVGYVDDYWLTDNSIVYLHAKGRGNRRVCNIDKYGFPRSSAKSRKTFRGFQTGDIIKAKYKGRLLIGRVIIRSDGRFVIQTKGKGIDIQYNNCRVIQKNSGYQVKHFGSAA